MVTSIETNEHIADTRALIVALFGSQMEASRRLHFHDRTVRWWCERGAPQHVLEVLQRLADGEIKLRWARSLMHTKRTRRVNGRHA
jgi:hypothetical protein